MSRKMSDLAVSLWSRLCPGLSKVPLVERPSTIRRVRRSPLLWGPALASIAGWLVAFRPWDMAASFRPAGGPFLWETLLLVFVLMCRKRLVNIEVAYYLTAHPAEDSDWPSSAGK